MPGEGVFSMSMRFGYRPELDGVRGLAIVMVVLGHAHLWPTGWAFGYGVDIFFVLSGYLITSLLVGEWQASGRVSLSGFYARRARRLLPALAAFLAGLAIVGVVGIELGRISWLGFAVTGLNCLYVTNWFSALHDLGSGNLYVSHLWSLAEEEQFYLVWPLVLIGAFRSQATMRQLRTLVVGVVVFAFVCELYTAARGTVWFYGYSPLSRSTPLAAGCLLAFVPPARLFAGQWIGLGMLTIAVALPVYVHIGGGMLMAPVWRLVVTAAALLLITQAGRLLAWKPLVWVGLISYSLYLWHPLLIHVLPKDRLWSHALAVALSVLAAAASYRWIEQPFRRRRHRAAFEHGTLEPAVAATRA